MTGFTGDPGKVNGPRESLLLGLLTFLVFGLAFWAPFIYDDVLFIANNADIVGPWQGWRHFLLTPNQFQDGYEPVSLLIHRGLFLIGGATPGLFRLSNILLHWLACVLVLSLFQELLGPGGPSFWLAALFAVYPSHTEDIAVATFKKHILVALSGLLMLHAERPWKAERAGWRRRAACASFLALGLFSKENAFILPAILAAVSLSAAPNWKERLGRDGWFFAALFSMDFAFLYWRAVVVPRSPGLLIGGSISTHLLTSAKCLVWYFREFLYPIRLCQEHSISFLPLAWSWPLAGVLGALAAGAAFAAWLWREDRIAFAGLAIAVLWLLPFLNLIPFLNLSLVANRYMYFSVAGLLLCVGRLTRPVWNLRFGRIPAMPLACAALGLCYIGVGMNNLAHYDNPVEVWERAICCAPVNPRVEITLGDYYRLRHDYAAAESEYRTAARFVGADNYGPLAANNLGIVFTETGRSKQALSLFSSLNRNFSFAIQYEVLGVAQLNVNDVDMAIRSFQEALRRNPSDATSRSNLAFCYLKKNMLRMAEIEWKTAASDPYAAALSWKNLAAVYMRQKRPAEAKRALERSLRSNPVQIDAVAHLAELEAALGHSQRGLDRFNVLIELLRMGQKTAFSSADEFTPREMSAAVAMLPVALKERARFAAKHSPDLLDSAAVGRD
ncbi:MAG: tetratricopeptide repeat protein [Elusimicrobiota bacterium]